jgi:glycosyltransferase involved in cell wall biosynthesis
MNMSAGIKNIVMPGWLTECQSKVLSERSKIMLAPLKDLPDFKMSIPNKFFDYMSNGKPIFSSISGVAGKLISDNNIGREYTNNDLDSLANLLKEVLADDNLIEEMSDNSRKLFLANFSSDKIYHNLVTHLVMMHNAH